MLGFIFVALHSVWKPSEQKKKKEKKIPYQRLKPKTNTNSIFSLLCRRIHNDSQSIFGRLCCPLFSLFIMYALYTDRHTHSFISSIDVCLCVCWHYYKLQYFNTISQNVFPFSLSVRVRVCVSFTLIHSQPSHTI